MFSFRLREPNPAAGANNQKNSNKLSLFVWVIGILLLLAACSSNTLTKEPEPGPSAPGIQDLYVMAGSDQAIVLSDVVTLTGLVVVSTPEGIVDATESVSILWEKVAGPGQVTFDNPHDLNSTANFSDPGQYELRLTASINDLSKSDSLVVDVQNTSGTIYYVALNGSDSNDGSLAAPFRTLNQAGKVVQPGDIVRVRGGVYYEYNDSNTNYGLPETSFTTNGTADKPIVIESYPGELAIFDGSKRPDGSPFRPEDGPSNRMQRPYLLYLPVNNYIVRNMEFRNSVGAGVVTDSAVDGRGNYNLFSNLHLHHNHGNGLTASGLSFTKSDGTRVNTTVTGNVAEYIVAHHNASIRNGGNSADGIKMSHAQNGVIRNSLLFKNSDDGIDFIGSEDMLAQDSLSWLNGYFWPADDTDPFRSSNKLEAPTGDGNGFKLAGTSSGSNSRNKAVRNVAWKNKLFGFTFNGGGGVIFYNNTSWKNKNGGFSARCFDSIVLRNNLSYRESNTITATATNCPKGKMPIHDHNSWNIGVGNPAFASTSPASEDFLQLGTGSPAIDKGMDLGYPFAGTAPDLGAFEFGQTIGNLISLSTPAAASLDSMLSQVNPNRLVHR